MSKRNVILGGIFALLGSFFLALIVFMAVGKCTLMNPEYLISMMDHVDYYEGINTELTKEFKQSSGAAGFDPEIYTDFLSTEDIKKEANRYVREYFSKKEAHVNEEEFKERLTTHIMDVIEKQGIKYTPEDQARLETYIDINVKGYVKYLQFPFIQYIDMAIDMMNQVFYFIIISAIVLFGVAMLFLLRVQIDRQQRLTYIISMISGSGLMISVIPLWILLKNYVTRVMLKPEYFYHFFTNYIEIFLWILVILGIVMIIISNIAPYLYRECKKRKIINAQKKTSVQ